MKLNVFWRLLAFLTLLSYVLLVFIILRFFIHNIGLTVLFGVTAVCLTVAVRLLFNETDTQVRKNIWLLIVSIFLFIVEAAYLVLSIENLAVFLEFGLLTIVYIGLITMLYKNKWRSKRQFAKQTSKLAKFKNPYLIINPKSGDGRAMKAHINTLAADLGIKVLVLKKGDDIETIARDAVKAGADVLGISGGDGSIGAVVKVAIEQKLPVVILPGGTRCHFARDLGLAPERIADALTGFNGVERRVDVGLINGRYFLNNASFGLYADIIDSPEYRDHKVAASRNVLRSITSGKKKLYDLKFNYGKLQLNKALQVLIGVNSYDTFNILELGHRNKLDDGLLQITVITESDEKSVRQLLKNLSTSKMNGMYQWNATEFKITNNEKKIVAGVDGEREDYDTPVTVRIMPKALHIFVPPEGVRVRKRNPFALPVMSQVWHAVIHQ